MWPGETGVPDESWQVSRQWDGDADVASGGQGACPDGVTDTQAGGLSPGLLEGSVWGAKDAGEQGLREGS